MTLRIALWDLEPDDAQGFASWKTDAVFAAHAVWRLTSEGFSPIGRDRAETFLGEKSYYERFEILQLDWRVTAAGLHW